MRRAAVCSIVPPHILRNIAERGEGDAAAMAQEAIALSAELRVERATEIEEAFARAGAPAEGGTPSRSIFTAGGKRILPGQRVELPSKDVAVREAFDGSGKTYALYWKAFDRDSIDGRGLRLDSTVHYGTRYSNALWNGRQMIYGDGDGRYFLRFTKCLDVIGHELTHGVTQYSARLGYKNESGALNEHFSDVFGVLTRQFAAKQTAAKADWLVGAGLYTKRVEGAAIRSMKAPGTAYDDPVLGKDPQPAHMRDYVRMTEDDGGVHINSGIPNRAFYELSILLGGKAWAVAGKIWYRTLTKKLESSSRFQECADATYESAGELFGAQSGPQDAVLAAWRAVGIVVSESIISSGPRLPVRAPEPYQPPAPAAEFPAALPRVRS